MTGEPQTTNTGATSDNQWSHKRQIVVLETRTTDTGATSDQQILSAGATAGRDGQQIPEPQTTKDTNDKGYIGATGQDDKYWSQERQILEP